MIVKDVVENCARLLALSNVLKSTEFGGSGGEDEENYQDTVKLLIRAVNMVVQDLAYTYLKLTANEKLEFTNSTIMLSRFTKPVIEINKVVSGTGALKFKVYPDSIELPVKTGSVTVNYSYAPQNLQALNDTVVNFGGKLNLDTLSFGACAEYLFIKGLFDDARVFEERFKNNLMSLSRAAHDVVMPERRWF